jgi:hypothetical protein
MWWSPFLIGGLIGSAVNERRRFEMRAVET